jgi:hypothetical protein
LIISSAHVRVRARVDVDRESRDRLLGDEMHGVVVEMLVAFRVRRLLENLCAANTAAAGQQHGRRSDCDGQRRVCRFQIAAPRGHGDIRHLLARFPLRVDVFQQLVDFFGRRLLRLGSAPIPGQHRFISLGGTGRDDGSHDQQRAAAHDTIHGEPSLRAPAAPLVYGC